MGTQKLIAVLFLSFCFLGKPAFATMFDGEMNSPGSIHSMLSEFNNIAVEIGLEYMHPVLPVIHNVVVENTSTSTAVSGPVRGDVQSDYPDTFAQTLKIQVLMDPESLWTVGVKTYLPLNGITQMDTGNTYQPEFVLYRAEAERPRILLSSGINLGPDWRIALGLDVGFSVSAQADVFLQSGDGTVSDQRVSAKVKPTFVPQASIGFDQYLFTVRGENRANFDLTTNAGARIFSNVSAGVDFSYTSQSVLFYQPWELEFDGQNRITDGFNLKWGVSYELWGAFPVRAAIIQTGVSVNCPSGATNCNSQFSSGQGPNYKARNIWVPEVGLQFQLGDNTLEIDYRYKDSIFTSVPNDDGNYLDPPRHDLLLGFTHPTDAGWQWNIHATVSRLSPQTVVKSDPDSIGGPGYSVDGWLYGGGLSVAIPFKD